MLPDLLQPRGLRLALERGLTVGHLWHDDDGADQSGSVRRDLALGVGGQSLSIFPPGDAMVRPGSSHLALQGPGLAHHQPGLGPQDLH